VGVAIGTGIGGIEQLIDPIARFGRDGVVRVTPHQALEPLCNMPGFHVSFELGSLGQLTSLVTACAAGTQALGEGLQWIRRGAVDVVVAGGTEAQVTPLFFAGFGRSYAFGSAARMGPGYFPVVLGAFLAFLGVVIVLGAMSPRAAAEEVASFAWRPLLLVVLPAIGFGLLLPYLGLIACLCLLVVVSSLASPEFSWRATLLNAVALTAICVVAFVWALKLQFELLPPFLG
jgi:hypothetical protein